MPADHEHRINEELTADEVSLKIAERNTKLTQERLRILGGAVAGGVGLLIGTVAILFQDNNMGALIGFGVMSVGFGLASFGQLKDLISSFFGRGGS